MNIRTVELQESWRVYRTSQKFNKSISRCLEFYVWIPKVFRFVVEVYIRKHWGGEITAQILSSATICINTCLCWSSPVVVLCSLLLVVHGQGRCLLCQESQNLTLSSLILVLTICLDEWVVPCVTVQLGESWDPWTQAWGGNRRQWCIGSLPKWNQCVTMVISWDTCSGRLKDERAQGLVKMRTDCALLAVRTKWWRDTLRRITSKVGARGERLRLELRYNWVRPS